MLVAASLAAALLASSRASAAPTVTMDWPLNGSVYAGGIRTAYGTAAATPGFALVSVKVRLTRVDSVGGTAGWDWATQTWGTSAPWRTAEGTGTWQVLGSFPATWPQQYTYWVEACAYDTFQSGASSRACFYTDSTAPTVQISYPENEAWYYSGIDHAEGTASDGDGLGVGRVYCQLYYYSDGDYTNHYWSWTTGAWQTGSSWDTMKLATGTEAWKVDSGFPTDWQPGRTYALYARAYDVLGNVGTNVSYFYIGDDEWPSIAITVPQANVNYPAGLQQAAGTAADTGGSGLSFVICAMERLDGNGGALYPRLYWNWEAGDWEAFTPHPQWPGFLDPRGWKTAQGTSNWTLADDLPTLWEDGQYRLYAEAVDGWGNWRGVWQNFPVADDVAPTITAPPDITVEQLGPGGTPAGQVHLGMPTVSDPGDPNPEVTNDAPVQFPPGVTVVAWTATDRAGHSATATQTVNVVDTTPPVIDLNMLRTTLRPANGKLVLAAEVSVSDAADPAPEVLISVTTDDPGKPARGRKARPDWETTRRGDVWEVWLRAENDGRSTVRVYTIGIEAADEAGNTATATGTVTVP